MNAKEALQRLMEGNERYVNDREDIDASEEVRAALKGGQKPFAIILSCADSRVVPEAIFDANPGEIFVVRVAGNVANTSSLASIEYAVAHLGTKLIMVLGHENCGAVTAAVAGGDHGYNLNHLLAHIVPAIDKSESPDVNEVVKVNAQTNAEELVTRSAIIRDALVEDGLEIASGFYNLVSGRVDVLE